MTGADLGLYLHVPFCRTRCRYCDFYRVGENRGRMDRFVPEEEAAPSRGAWSRILAGDRLFFETRRVFLALAVGMIVGTASGWITVVTCCVSQQCSDESKISRGDGRHGRTEDDRIP